MAVREKVCPQCRSPLHKVTQSPNSPLNRDQFDSSKAGDYFCEFCPDNARGQSGLCYWWESELPFAHDYQI